MTIRIIIISSLTFFLYKTGFAQDPQFSQFYSNPLYQSPSFAGTSEGYRGTINYRNQWPKMPGKVETFSTGIDVNIMEINSGLGLIVMRDVIGVNSLSTLSAGLLYSYNVKVNRRLFLRPGIGFYYLQKAIDRNSMILSSEIDALNPDNPGSPVRPQTLGELQNRNAMDGGISLLALSRDLWAGVTLDHLFAPNVSFTERAEPLPVKYTVYGGYRFRKVERLVGTKKQVVTVAGTYRHQGAADQFDVGLYWTYDPLILGIWYRDLPLMKENSNRDAIIIMLGAKLDMITLGYSYDFTVSQLVTTTGGAHELSMIYRFEVSKKKKFKQLPCPEF